MSRDFLEIVPWPPGRVGRGLQRDTRWHERDHDYATIETEGLKRIGAVMEWRTDEPACVRLRLSRSRISAVNARIKSAATLRDDVAYFDLRKVSSATAVCPIGQVRVKSERQGLVITVTLDETVQPFALASPPLFDWCRQLGDEWLADEVKTRIAGADPWDIACCAGIVITLTEPAAVPRTNTPAAALEARAVLVDVLEAARAWARAWTSDEYAAIQALALVSVELVDARLRDVAATAKSRTRFRRVWVSELKRLCHLRADLEGVLMLLQSAERADVVRGAVAMVDRRAQRLIQTLELDGPLDDEMLRRVALHDPEAWWGWPAAPEDGNDALAATDMD